MIAGATLALIIIVTSAALGWRSGSRRKLSLSLALLDGLLGTFVLILALAFASLFLMFIIPPFGVFALMLIALVSEVSAQDLAWLLPGVALSLISTGVAFQMGREA
ncbi:MAG: hypothetical protein ACSHXB_04795 [Sulfitobacter sp.]